MDSTIQRQIHELQMVDIVKRFPGVLANDHVNLTVKAGEIHALLGENGAGKSTLMRVLYGLYQPDDGQISIDGKPIRFESPADAIEIGIGMVHQHFMLVPSLTVVENVALGLKSSRGLLLDLDVVAARCAELSKRYGLNIEPDVYVWQLSVGEQQRVEIIKALYRGASLLVLDEPTAVLTPQEVSDLFVTLRELIAAGHSIIFISHKLHEVLAISENVTVLRNGKTVGTYQTDEMSKPELAQLMVGREIVEQIDHDTQSEASVRFEVRDLRVGGDRDNEAVCGVSFKIHSGEILGIAGVSGNGQRELAEALSGLRPIIGGQVFLDGDDIANKKPAEITEAGVAFIPEGRNQHGVIGDFSVVENMILRDFKKPPFAKGIFFDQDKARAHVDALVDSYQIKTPTTDTPVKNLSGGNVQKLILARELSRDPIVLIAAQPTRGVDIGATEYIHEQMIRQRDSGTATLMISEDLDEIRSMSDRIAVMYEGELMGIVDAQSASTEELGLMMAGSKRDDHAKLSFDSRS